MLAISQFLKYSERWLSLNDSLLNDSLLTFRNDKSGFCAIL